MERFLYRPLDPNLQFEHWSALHGGASQNSDIVRLLLEARADKDKADGYRGKTPLVIASEFGQVDSVRLLLEAKADTNAAATEGETAIYSACCRNRVDVVKLLLEVRADMDKPDIDGRSPIAAAALRGDALQGMCWMFIHLPPSPTHTYPTPPFS